VRVLVSIGMMAAILVSACAAPSTQQTTPPGTPAEPSTTQHQEQMEVPSPSPAQEEGNQAGANADVTFVRAQKEDEGTWRFEVTVQHPDTGWEDYADGWDVVLPDGTALKPNPDDAFTRVLLHPHVDEQPFTRSQSGIKIPPGVTTVRVRAHDLVDGFGGEVVEVDLTAESGPGFEVER